MRVDFIEDDVYIQTLINVAEEYLKNATGVIFDSTNNLARLYCLVLISDMYENRAYTTDKVSERIRISMQSILTQLQYCYGSDTV